MADNLQILNRSGKYLLVKLFSVRGLQEVLDKNEIDILHHFICTKGSVVTTLTKSQYDKLEDIQK